MIWPEDWQATRRTVGRSSASPSRAIFTRFVLLLFLILLLPCIEGQPLNAATDTVIARFEARYHAAKSLSAVFLEQYLDNGKITRQEAGKAYFLRPGKMRWDYEVPEKNMFLADGRYVWFYTPADRTVTRMAAKNSEDWRTPLAFLTTGMKLSRICSRVVAAGAAKASEADNLVYRCVLRGMTAAEDPAKRSDKRGDAPEKVLFELSPEGELRRIVIEEQAGIQMEFRFREWQWNPALQRSEFEFKPPAGVVIVEGELPDMAGMRQ